MLIRVKKPVPRSFGPADIFESLGKSGRRSVFGSPAAAPDTSQNDESEVPSLKLTGLLLIWCGEFVFELCLPRDGTWIMPALSRTPVVLDDTAPRAR
jgi:hypothetical protein